MQKVMTHHFFWERHLVPQTLQETRTNYELEFMEVVG